VSTLTEALTATIARRDADELAAAREEQREACADEVYSCVYENTLTELAASIRRTPLEATPLGDELAALRTAKAEEGLAYRLELAALRAEVASLKADAQMLSDDDDACHRLLDKALGEGSLATTSMETLLERLPRLIASHAALAATAEPATPTYSADDLRKVARATNDAAAWHVRNSPKFEGVFTTPADNGLLGRVAQDIENLDLDAIIAKAVGRE